MSGDQKSSGPTAAGTLRVRTALLETAQQYDTARWTRSSDVSHSPADRTSEAKGAEDLCSRASLLKVLVQRNPNVTNPSWAMEECGRLCPSAELWCGSALPKDVWAPPGSLDCPFGTEPADFRMQH